MKIVKCDVCNNEIKLDSYNQGKCKQCGWNYSNCCVEYPNNVNPPNFCSLNEAKELWKNKEQYEPAFERMMELIERGLEFSFKYKGKRYLVEKYLIWQEKTEMYLEFSTLDELKNAQINGYYLKDIWKDVKQTRYEC